MRTYIPIAQIIARDPLWAERIRARDRRKCRRLRAKNPERARQLGRDQRAKKIEHYRSVDRSWYAIAGNKEKVRMKKERFRLNNRARLIRNFIKHRCTNKKLGFDLTVEWIEARLTAGVCEMSGVPFDMKSRNGRNCPTVDRIVAGGPYTQSNCRMILWSINRALSNWGDDYILGVFEKVLARRQSDG